MRSTSMFLCACTIYSAIGGAPTTCGNDPDVHTLLQAKNVIRKNFQQSNSVDLVESMQNKAVSLAKDSSVSMDLAAESMPPQHHYLWAAETPANWEFVGQGACRTAACGSDSSWNCGSDTYILVSDYRHYDPLTRILAWVPTDTPEECRAACENIVLGVRDMQGNRKFCGSCLDPVHTTKAMRERSALQREPGTCAGYEFHAEDGRCELHTEIGTFSENADYECWRKTEVVPWVGSNEEHEAQTAYWTARYGAERAAQMGW